jgi:hypothetical protein
VAEGGRRRRLTRAKAHLIASTDHNVTRPTQAMREVELDEVQRELATMNREVATAIDPAVRASPTTGSAGSGGGSTVPPPPHEADRAPTETIHDQPSSPAPADKRTGES